MLCECDVHDGEFSSAVLMENEGAVVMRARRRKITVGTAWEEVPAAEGLKLL
jgi:hypothetical protein